MSAEPLTREERSDFALQANPIGWAGAVVIPRYEATVQAAEAKQEELISQVVVADHMRRAAEERAERLVYESRTALAMLNDSQHERDQAIAWHKRINAARILHAALAADDAARGEAS